MLRMVNVSVAISLIPNSAPSRRLLYGHPIYNMTSSAATRKKAESFDERQYGTARLVGSGAMARCDRTLVRRSLEWTCQCCADPGAASGRGEVRRPLAS